MSARIVLVSDSIETIDALRARCEGMGHEVTEAPGEDVTAILRHEAHDVVLIEVPDPKCRAIELIGTLSADLFARHTPVIVLTPDTETFEKIVPLGLQVFDYVTSPYSADDLDARVAAARRAKSFQEEIRSHTNLDPTTNLLNRKGGEDRIREEIARAIRYGRSLACLVLRVEPAPPEEEIQGLGQLLRRHMRLSDVLCRWERSVILGLLPETGPFGAARAAENLRKLVEVEWVWGQGDGDSLSLDARMPELSLAAGPVPLAAARQSASDGTGAGGQAARERENEPVVYLGASGYIDGDDWQTLSARAELAAQEARGREGAPVMVARGTPGTSEIRFIAV